MRDPPNSLNVSFNRGKVVKPSCSVFVDVSGYALTTLGPANAVGFAPVEFESYGGSMDDLWKMYGLHVTVWMICEWCMMYVLPPWLSILSHGPHNCIPKSSPANSKCLAWHGIARKRVGSLPHQPTSDLPGVFRLSFLSFLLDIKVHQMTEQFPTAFEFSSALLLHVGREVLTPLDSKTWLFDLLRFFEVLLLVFFTSFSALWRLRQHISNLATVILCQENHVQGTWRRTLWIHGKNTNRNNFPKMKGKQKPRTNTENNSSGPFRSAAESAFHSLKAMVASSSDTRWSSFDFSPCRLLLYCWYDVCMYVCMYVCLSVCLSVCMYVCMCMYVCNVM